jgi:hypothetical protein
LRDTHRKYRKIADKAIKKMNSKSTNKGDL